MTERPDDIQTFVEWLSTKGEIIDDKWERWFKMSSNSVLATIEDHPFFSGLTQMLGTAALEYKAKTGSDLFVNSAPPDLRFYTKSPEATVNKLFRVNVVWNQRWPSAPKKGWVHPYELFGGLDDIVRTRWTCKYFDGPAFVLERLESLATSHSLAFESGTRELDEGYYSHHAYITADVEIVDVNFAAKQTKATLEIQLTTQLQEVLQNLTHKQYEERRVVFQPDRKAWKWEHTSDAFRTAYLGHTLHLLEGLILDLRDSKEPT